MTLQLDHLVVAARTLEEGAQWVAERLGVEPVPGGTHPLMGTHNRLLGLGPGAYLEVIAIDPQGPTPLRPRWFSLDAPETRVRLERGPTLLHWVARAGDLSQALRGSPTGPVAIEGTRGDLRWKIGVPVDGTLAFDGLFPTFIDWEGSAHPSASLPEAGITLTHLAITHPRAPALEAALQTAAPGPAPWLTFDRGASALVARLATPRGPVTLEK